MANLGVNIDHVATVRQARRAGEPDPVVAALLAEQAGADSITAHLREDRRHIQDRDIRQLRRVVRTRLNLEMSVAASIAKIACRLKPDQVTLVPERRQEITTEGGLDVAGQSRRVGRVVKQLQRAGITVSLFIDPREAQVDAACATGASHVELHTGEYARARIIRQQRAQLNQLKKAADYAQQRGLHVNAGHGLTYDNIAPVVRALPLVEEYNIGHSIISRAVLVGIRQAVREMKVLVSGNEK